MQRRARDVLTLIICRPKNLLIVVTISNREVIFLFIYFFCNCIVKVIFSAVNLPSQITLLSLGISYVFPSLSPLNLPLSCPEPFVANRARRSEVFKVDVWVGNSANVNVAYGSLPSAFCSPRACGACQLSLVSAVPQSQRPHGACITLGSRGCLCVQSHSWGARGGGQAEMSIMALQLTNDGRSKRKVQTRELAHAGGRKAEFLNQNLKWLIFHSPYGKAGKQHWYIFNGTQLINPHFNPYSLFIWVDTVLHLTSFYSQWQFGPNEKVPSPQLLAPREAACTNQQHSSEARRKTHIHCCPVYKYIFNITG